MNEAFGVCLHLYCNNNIYAGYGMMGGGMMNIMMGSGMMGNWGYFGYWNFLNVLYAVLLIGLIILVYSWITKLWGDSHGKKK